MAFALRLRESASAITSRKGSHALGLGVRPRGGGHGARSGSGDTSPVVAVFGGPGSVDTPAVVAGFAGPESVDTPAVVAGFGGHTSGRPPRARTATPAAFRYALAVSRRTEVASSIRLSDQPSRPSARICCFFSSPKTLPIPAGAHAPLAFR